MTKITMTKTFSSLRKLACLFSRYRKCMTPFFKHIGRRDIFFDYVTKVNFLCRIAYMLHVFTFRTKYCETLNI